MALLVQIVPIAVMLAILAAVFAAIYYERASRPVIGLSGAIATVFAGEVLGIYSVESAFQSIFFSTLVLLVSMNAITTIVKRNGVFDWIAYQLLVRLGFDYRRIFISLVLATYFFSTMVNNLTVVLIVVPLTLRVMDTIKRDPIPLVVVEIISTNLGGASTMVGDFPNMIIAAGVGIGFDAFATFMLPICLFFVLLLTILSVSVFYPKEFKQTGTERNGESLVKEHLKRHFIVQRNAAVKDRIGLLISLAFFFGVLGMFIFSGNLGLPPSLISMTAAILLLLVDQIRARREELKSFRGRKLSHEERMQIRNNLDRRMSEIFGVLRWDATGFLAGLFVIVGGLEATGFLELIAHWVVDFSRSNIVLVSIMIIMVAPFITMFTEAGPSTALMLSMIKALNVAIPYDVSWWALSLGVQAGSSATMVGATEGPAAAAQVEEHYRNLSVSYRLTPSALSRIGLPMLPVFVIGSAIYVTLVITMGPVAPMLFLAISAILAIALLLKYFR